uniref:Amiloride-sensitive sodium channel n=1 Tax=Heterorhabditis bacteriophora TaxID=37862 RepID=A0A1I7XCQ5_HETBA
MRIFWWFVMVVCIICGTTTTILVILEYVEGPTATSTTIKLVDSLELPAITICPKVPDAFNAKGLLSDIKKSIPNINEILAMDLVRFWIGGNGLENMDKLSYFNRTYLSHLNILYKIWSKGYSTEEFFNLIQVMLLNQSEADDIGRLVLSIKALSSVTSPQFNFTQPQLIVYVTDNFNNVVDYPRFYLYPHEWNRMRFTARYIELIKNKGICTDQIFGRDAECVIRKWLLSNIVYPFNCTLSYMQGIRNLPFKAKVCAPDIIADNYYNNIQLVGKSMTIKEQCTPGCKRWDYQISLQQSQTLSPFSNYVFNFEASFNDLQVSADFFSIILYILLLQLHILVRVCQRSLYDICAWFCCTNRSYSLIRFLDVAQGSSNPLYSSSQCCSTWSRSNMQASKYIYIYIYNFLNNYYILKPMRKPSMGINSSIRDSQGRTVLDMLEEHEMQRASDLTQIIQSREGWSECRRIIEAYIHKIDSNQFNSSNDSGIDRRDCMNTENDDGKNRDIIWRPLPANISGMSFQGDHKLHRYNDFNFKGELVTISNELDETTSALSGNTAMEYDVAQQRASIASTSSNQSYVTLLNRTWNSRMYDAERGIPRFPITSPLNKSRHQSSKRTGDTLPPSILRTHSVPQRDVGTTVVRGLLTGRLEVNSSSQAMKMGHIPCP